jgi:hypothetical protein
LTIGRRNDTIEAKENTMYAVEFEATVHDGLIEVPVELRKTLSERVRVILLVREPRKRKRNAIAELMDHPLRLPDPRPLTREEIYER